MKLPQLPVGQLLAVLAAASFGLSGAFIKPLLAGGWSPAAAVTVRVLVGGLVLLAPAVVALRGRWGVLWPARRRILGMGLVGVAGAQLTYFAAVQRIPVGTAILIELSAPLLLVAIAWAVTRRMPAWVVLVGSAVAALGLTLTVSGGSSGPLDPMGVLFAVGALISCAAYFVIAARPNDGVPPVALAAFALLIAGAALGLAGLVGVVPFTASAADVSLFGSTVGWWVPMLIVGVLATAVAYAASIAASERIGSRLASFLALLEVAAASIYAWLLLDERMTVSQLIGGGLIVIGIVFVRSDKRQDPLSPEVTGPEVAAVAPGAVTDSGRARVPAS